MTLRSKLCTAFTSFTVATCLFVGVAYAEKRIALVIGNSAYEHATPLANPRNDAEAMARELRTLGFQTFEGYDLTIDELEDTFYTFADEIEGADVTMVFYAGHGIAIEGQNYIVPIDAQLSKQSSIKRELFPLEDVMEQLGYGNGANLVILDACRDNPLLSRSLASNTRSVSSGGLAEVQISDTGSGTGIIFATEPGQVAYDGDGSNSPFTQALLQHIGTPGISTGY